MPSAFIAVKLLSKSEKFVLFSWQTADANSCIASSTSIVDRKRKSFAVACDCVINPAGAVFFTSSASSIKNEQNVLRHCEAAANEAAFIAREPNSQHSPQRESISISNRPFSVQAGEQAIAKNRRKTFTTVSSLFVVGNIPEVALTDDIELGLSLLEWLVSAYAQTNSGNLKALMYTYINNRRNRQFIILFEL
uniref:Uncharacterized protein n=1 Tax=Glossina pallidipes TaxID=7398 RepID=A0A1A9ZQE9_GLOPL